MFAHLDPSGNASGLVFGAVSRKVKKKGGEIWSFISILAVMQADLPLGLSRGK